MEHDIHVWHDKAGRIVAWGHVGQRTPLAVKATPLAKRGQGVVTVRLPEQDMYTLHQTHRVEPKSKKLVPVARKKAR